MWSFLSLLYYSTIKSAITGEEENDDVLPRAESTGNL